MRIVNLVTFLAMRPGTVFSKYEPCVFGELMVKHDSSGSTCDFYCSSLTTEVDSSELGEMVDLLETSEQTGSSVPLHFNTVCRDGLYEQNQLFAVWEQSDVVGLIDRLQKALDDGYGDDQPAADAGEIRTIAIWSEGYRATGEAATATLHGEFEGKTFSDAVELYLQTLGLEDRAYYHQHDDGSWSCWGCRLFDNEADARKAYG